MDGRSLGSLVLTRPEERRLGVDDCGWCWCWCWCWCGCAMARVVDVQSANPGSTESFDDLGRMDEQRASHSSLNGREMGPRGYPRTSRPSFLRRQEEAMEGALLGTLENCVTALESSGRVFPRLSPLGRASERGVVWCGVVWSCGWMAGVTIVSGVGW